MNLSSAQFDYLIKHSNLKQVDYGIRSPLLFALKYNNEENLNLTKEQWKYLIDNSNLSLIKDNEDLLELKKIQSELISEKILNKINKEETKKVNKI